jgi:hypothetical protein
LQQFGRLSSIVAKHVRPCRLCLVTKPLLRSHILPEFVFRPTYDEKHRAFYVAPDETLKGPVQNGFRERLLCSDCEQRLSEYERYVADVWFSQILPAQIPADGLTIEGLDYSRFKLFHLSLIWRASVSRLSEFEGMHLGPHEEVIRTMLLTAVPGPADCYRILGSFIVRPSTSEVVRTMVLTPSNKRIRGANTCVSMFGGCAWICVISTHASEPFFEAALNANGRMYLPAVRFDQLSDVAAIYRRIRAARVERYEK